MEAIDRASLVRRHNVHFTTYDPHNPLSVGNGNFAFSADCTGLQTFALEPGLSIPLATMSQWGWHRYHDSPPNADYLQLHYYDAGGRPVGYMTDPGNQQELFDALRRNPHRFNLGIVGFCSESGEPVKSYEIRNVNQTLDLYNAIITSSFTMNASQVRVETLCHPDMDLVAFRIKSTGKIRLAIRFPYASHLKSASNWDSPDLHSSELNRLDTEICQINRTMDATVYSLSIASENAAIDKIGNHQWLVSTDQDVLELRILFSPEPNYGPLPSFDECKKACSRWWGQFWAEGAAISFEGSRDTRAHELERRVILSQYLTAIQCMGSLPPQETGLTCNSWYGKFHLEMHVWHAAWAILYNHPALVERSLQYYRKIAPLARERARQQGYQGLRWPKMTDPCGADSPSTIGPLLCWQQPHLLYFSELLHRCTQSSERAKKYVDLVFEIVEFMVDYVQWDVETQRFVLGPPVIPAQENHPSESTLNPLFELEYFRWGIATAIEWKRRLKQDIPARWKHVLEHLSECPLDTVMNTYMAHEHCPDTYGSYADDHPSFLFAYGFLPSKKIDVKHMSASFDAVLKHWRFESMWGWDFPAMAMTAARLGRKKDAIDLLLLDSPKNTYMPNGHNRQGTSEALPLYLPGNGALLLAVAMMAGGWNGSTGNAPGFPDDGSWHVCHEGFVPYL
ncbi:MAG: hypothetical protein RBT04_06235 [Sphaerochaetaceae bacterium]|nr:hypothetical protein [Sphaerochaetaceae bacterium]